MELKSITKKYGNILILDNLSFDLNKGEIVGLIGKNGAGKSTVMKIITQTIPMYQGDILGNEKVGYLIEEPKLYNNKTGLEHLKYFSEIFGLQFKIDDYKELLHSIQLYDDLEKKVKKYSLGMRQKLGIVISLLTNPEFIILDEPTNSMDIETSFEVLQGLKKMVEKKNIGILISSHKLEDIETICDRFLFLRNGKITRQEKNNNSIVKITLAEVTKMITYINKHNLGKVIYAGEQELHINSTLKDNYILDFINKSNIAIIDLNIEKRTLRDIYMSESRGENL
ncbi:ABC transporter ATP-binding protein [Staphylococcus equorum]|uniref:ABC transporter ATP-binding protein n=1 Tax=Staphylococcus equorum TaxID=246432 RepID=A0A9X4L9T7_9STAP|nr:ABC transporter ATP-binding protein [Staphylococcus equorum]MDG0819668.1 ABC transporter ATP-binding protein [Staphylococcus equorum]MDG0840309.1 ABC transporter ATP-binding protein [Staphylococcus equorum]MDG0845992.1 ABC transporter ATP-binding protein [Staphylococcus equorum]